MRSYMATNCMATCKLCTPKKKKPFPLTIRTIRVNEPKPKRTKPKQGAGSSRSRTGSKPEAVEENGGCQFPAPIVAELMCLITAGRCGFAAFFIYAVAVVDCA